MENQMCVQRPKAAEEQQRSDKTQMVATQMSFLPPENEETISSASWYIAHG
jgi:hypothetical protein